MDLRKTLPTGCGNLFPHDLQLCAKVVQQVNRKQHLIAINHPLPIYGNLVAQA